MTNFSMYRFKKTDKNDLSDLTNLAISQYTLVFSIGGS